MMKRRLKILLIALAVYAALLVILVAVESASPDATIHNLWDALWFSLITMTTVGYGDLSPVTAGGRAVGIIFALCSIGILTLLIGIGLSIISGHTIPSLRLRFGRRKTWYVFDSENEDTAVLAEELRKSTERCLLVFPASSTRLVTGTEVVRLDANTDSLLRLRGGNKDGMFMFFMVGDPWKDYSEATEAAEKGIHSYCMADVVADDIPEELELFSRREALSRCYWKEHPLKNEDGCVILIGCGQTGSALLERALLTNVFEKGRTTEYHVFDDSADFETLHPELMEYFASKPSGEDSLVFHEGSWTSDPELIRTADRIIICCDEDADALETYETLKTWFPTGATVHVRLTAPVPGVPGFGERKDVITREFVMRDAVNRQARMMHAIYSENSPSPVEWKDLSYFLRQSNIAAADHLIVKARYLLGDENMTELREEDCRRAYERFREVYADQADILQEMEHRRWMRFHLMFNWKYDPVRNNSHRRHPLLLPYDELSQAEQRKDAYAWEMLGRI